MAPNRRSKTVIHIHTGKQRFLCRSCGRQFVKDPANKVIDSQTRELIDRLLLERLSMAGIARAVQVSEQWLAVKPVISRDSTVRSASESHGSYGVAWRSRRACATILACCGTSSTTTTHHYLCSTTPFVIGD